MPEANEWEGSRSNEVLKTSKKITFTYRCSTIKCRHLSQMMMGRGYGPFSKAKTVKTCLQHFFKKFALFHYFYHLIS